jgi:hypothetical protein
MASTGLVSTASNHATSTTATTVLLLPLGSAAAIAMANQPEPRDDAVLTADEQADALGRGRNQRCLAAAPAGAAAT